MKTPKADKTSFIHERSTVIGDVVLEKNTSVWPGAVLRGDVNRIVIGENSNVQDNTVIHVDFDRPTVIGKFVTIGHNVTLHACTIGDGALIGNGAIVLDGAVIGEGAIIAAGSLIVPRATVPPRTLWRGHPAKQVSGLSDGEAGKGRELALAYSERIVKLYREDS